MEPLALGNNIIVKERSEEEQKKEKTSKSFFPKESCFLSSHYWNYMEIKQKSRCKKRRQNHIVTRNGILIFKVNLEDPGFFFLPITLCRI